MDVLSYWVLGRFCYTAIDKWSTWEIQSFQSHAFFAPREDLITHAPASLIWNTIYLSTLQVRAYLQGSGKANEQGRLDTKIITKLKFFFSSLDKDTDTEILSYHKKSL